MSRSLLAGALLLAALPAAALPAQAQRAPLADVTLADGRLGFCGVSLGDPVDAGTEEADGSFYTDLELCGRTVAVRVYATDAGEHLADMLWIPREDSDAPDLWDLPAMRRALRTSLPGAAFFEGPYEPGVSEAADETPQYRVAGADEQILVLKPDEAVYMEYGDGYD